MSQKSRQGKAKAKHGKKSKIRPALAAVTLQPQAAEQAIEPIPAEEMPEIGSAPMAAVAAATASYPYIATELKTVSFLAGILLVILIILGLTLA